MRRNLRSWGECQPRFHFEPKCQPPNPETTCKCPASQLPSPHIFSPDSDHPPVPWIRFPIGTGPRRSYHTASSSSHKTNRQLPSTNAAELPQSESHRYRHEYTVLHAEMTKKMSFIRTLFILLPAASTGIKWKRV